MARRQIKKFDILTTGQARKAGFTAESRPVVRVNLREVPPALRHLVPHVERWAIGCDVRRGDYFEKQSDKDIREFWRAVKPFVAEINEWLDSLPSGQPAKWPNAAIHFMYMLVSHLEATPPEEWARLRKQAIKRKISAGGAGMRSHRNLSVT